MKETKSTCPYCGVGCGVIIESTGDAITGVRGDPDHPANFGRLCTKGSTLHLTATHTLARQTRLLQPLQRLHRHARPDEVPSPLPWIDAVNLAATRLGHIAQEHGPDALGFYISGQLLTEDYYVFNKLAKGVVGTNNVDTNSRLCMSSAVAGYKQTLGADAPPACYDDVNHADCLFIAGSNTAYAHPVLFRRIEDARRANPGMKLIVVDPRKTDTATVADMHLDIQPGSDVMLFNGMLHIMLWEGWIHPAYIHAHTTGFEAQKALAREATPDLVSQVCGIPKEQVFEAARLFAQSKATLSLYCQGLNQSSSGTAKNAALVNLHLATGQIGRPGAGPFSLTGQPNAMGGREVGGLANLLSAHRDMGNPTHRAEVAALWRVPSVPSQAGKTAVEMFQAAADGQIKALWIVCTNPAQSLPDQATVRRALQRAEFVIVQEAFANTESCQYADLLLPATTWGEKDGTVTNSERRISRVRAAVHPPHAHDVGDAGPRHHAGEGPRHDWQIASLIGKRLARLLGKPESLMDYANPESVWVEHRESTRGRDLDITGLSYATLDAQGPQQWPYPAGATTGRARLYENGVYPTPDGKARFAPTPFVPLAEPRDPRYPFSLNTGRLRDQWHGMSRTGQLGRLFGHVPEPVLQMHPQDMARRNLKDGDLVHVTSRRGSIIAPLQGSSSVGLSQAFMGMHWGSSVLGGAASVGTPLAGVNALTVPAFCPSSKQPELKHAAVKVLKAELPWKLLALAWLPPERAQAAQQQLARLFGQFPFASCVPFTGPDTEPRTGILFRAAGHDPAPDALLGQIEAILGLNLAGAMRYADARKGQRRVVLMDKAAAEKADVKLSALLLAGDTEAEAWIKPLLQDRLPAQAYGRQLLLPGSKAPLSVAPRAHQVCTCFNVSASAITGCLGKATGSVEEQLQRVQAELQCGTNCGSCLPEVRAIVVKHTESIRDLQTA